MKNLLARLFPAIAAPHETEIEILRQNMLAIKRAQDALAAQQNMESYQLNGVTLSCMDELTGANEDIRTAFKILMSESDLPINFHQAVKEYSHPAHPFKDTIQPIIENAPRVHSALQNGLQMAVKNNFPEMSR